MSRIEKAVSYFEGNCNCAQAVLSSFSTQYGLDRDLALKIATGFGGGMARFGRTCGAVTGAYMAIGLKYGMGVDEDTEAKEETNQVIREFTNRFEEINGTVICKDVHTGNASGTSCYCTGHCRFFPGPGNRQGGKDNIKEYWRNDNGVISSYSYFYCILLFPYDC